MKQLKIGIIGAGRIGSLHAKSITYNVPTATVVGITDVFKANAEKVAAELNIPKIYNDYKEMLADPEVEAVLVCSSTDTHADIAIEAAEAGKHIFCEKPVDLTPEKVNAVIAAVEKAKVKLQVGFNRRFDHNFANVRAMVNDGKIGDVHIVKITSRDPAPPPAEYSAVSGGMFLDMTIHDFDMARFLAGSEVTEVYANATCLVDPAIGEAGDVDTAVITIKMENGAIAVIDNSRRAAYGYDQRAEVFGSKGMAATSNDTASSVVLSTDAGVTGEKPLYFFLERYMQSFATEVGCFIDAIENDTDTPLGVVDGLKPVLMGIAAKKSVAEHRPVKISEIEY